MVEDGMYFVAGFLVAGLLAVLILPAFWRRALRLSARRVRLLAPLSVTEAIAERDQLRAEHSVAERRLERRMNNLEAVVASHRAGLGRQAKQIVELEGQSADQANKIVERDRDLEAKRREAAGLEAELGASRIALADVSAQLDAAKQAAVAHGDAQVHLDIRADEQRAAIAALETRAAGLEARLADQAQAAKLRAEAQEAGRAREMHLAREKLENVEMRVALSERAREEALLESGRRLAELAQRDAALAEKDRLIGELNERLDRVAQGAATQVPPGAEQSESDRALREAIVRLGGDVLRLSGESEQGPMAGSPIGPRRRRQSMAKTRDDDGKGEGSARRERSPSPAP